MLYCIRMILRFSPDAARREMTPVDNLFFLTYMPDADGMFVKVYLYGLMQCYHAALSEDSIADALGLTEAQVRCAFVYWQSRGLVRITSEEPFAVEYLLTEQEALTRAVSVKHRSLIESVNGILSPRTLQLREMKAVYDCVELYDLSEDAVRELILHCAEVKGKRVSMNYVLTVAQSWKEQGIVQAEQAQQYVEQYRLKKHGATEVLRRWNKRRNPTKDEMDLYDRWINDWGFDSEAILTACAKLVTAGTPTFAALGLQLEELLQQGKTTKMEIERLGDSEQQWREFAKLVFARMGKVEVPNRTDTAQLTMFVSEKGIEREAILLAAEECIRAERPWGMLKRILSDWAREGIKTTESAKADLNRRASGPKRSAAKNRAAQGYQQSVIRMEDVEHLVLDLNEDL